MSRGNGRPLLGQGSAADQQHFALVTEGSKVHPIKAAPELPAAVRLLRFPDEVLLETRDTGEPIGWFPCAIPTYKENEMVASRDGRTWAASDGSYVYVFQVEYDQAD